MWSSATRFMERVDALAETLPLALGAVTAARSSINHELAGLMSTASAAITQQSAPGSLSMDFILKFWRTNKQSARIDVAIASLPQSFLVTLVSEFDAFMGKLLKLLFSTKPQALEASDKQISLTQVLKLGSIDDFRAAIIDKEVEAFLRLSHSDQFSYFEKRFGVKIKQDLHVWSEFIELTERRNLFVHNEGIVNDIYLANCAAAGFDCTGIAKGKLLPASPEYFARAHEVVFETALKFAHVLWRKILPHERAAADQHLTGIVVYELLFNARYRLAATMADFGATTCPVSSSDHARRQLAINRAQAYKWLGNEKRCNELVNAEDWSSCSDEFLLCVAALRSDETEVIRLMRKIGKSAETAINYRDWPIFKELRRTKGFADAFLEVFGEPLTVLPTTAQPPPDSENKPPALT